MIRPAPVSVPERAAISHPASPPAERGKKPSPVRKKKEDSAKKFFASMIAREDAGDAVVSKDDMYYAFERWARDHKVLTVPDKKSFAVTLKNQFAVREKMVDGTPSWLGVKVKG
jgi:hypothetical protein